MWYLIAFVKMTLKKNFESFKKVISNKLFGLQRSIVDSDFDIVLFIDFYQLL